MKIRGFDLIETCHEMPEQYDVFKDGRRCGYIRVRYGIIEADYWPESQEWMDPTVYEERFSDSLLGRLPDKYREFYLSKALRKLKQYMKTK